MRVSNMKVLFSNIGRRTYLIEYLNQLDNNHNDLEIFVSDTSLHTAGFWCYPGTKHFILSRVSDDEEYYKNVLLERCIKEKIDLIIPLMDFELLILAKYKELFKRSGITIVISDLKVIENCLNKKQNYQFCKQNQINMPKSFFDLDTFNNQYPVIKKRILSSASIGQKLVQNENELHDFKNGIDMLQKFIKGQEYGIDIFNDLNGNFVHACIKEKIEMRAGETDKCKVVYLDKLWKFSERLSGIFKHIGNMDVDIMIDENDNMYCIDFNPRFGGGYPFTHIAGFNYLGALLAMYNSDSYDIPKIGKSITGMKGISINYYED